MHRLKKRRDYLKVARGDRTPRRGFLLQSTRRDAGAKAVVEDGPRFGFTVTKKIGNAVVRNRMKRRFRALLREKLPTEGLPDHDHVMIGREGGIERDFSLLREELTVALARATAGKGDPPRRPRGAGRGTGRGAGGKVSRRP